MANSSISIDVSAANSKLAQFLRKREEEEAILQIGKKKVRDQARQSNGKARQQQDQTIPPKTDESIERAERIKAAELLYPPPEAARTRQVATFIRLLREDAPKDKIQEAAEAVRADVVAREDVQRLGIELARAYNTILDDDAVMLARERQRQRGR